MGRCWERGLLLPGQELWFEGRPERAATLLADGSLRLPGGERGSIHRLGALLSGQPSCNGWDHWHYRDAGGALVPIETLRALVRADGDH